MLHWYAFLIAVASMSLAAHAQDWKSARNVFADPGVTGKP